MIPSLDNYKDNTFELAKSVYERKVISINPLYVYLQGVYDPVVNN